MLVSPLSRQGSDKNMSIDEWSSITFRLVVIGAILLITGCISSLSEEYAWLEDLHGLGDGGLMAGEPCGPPCFLGITPGVSTVSEVIVFLEEHKILQWCEIESAEIKCMQIDDFTSSLWFLFDDRDTVSVIGFIPADQILLGDIVDTYGGPTRIELYLCRVRLCLD